MRVCSYSSQCPIIIHFLVIIDHVLLRKRQNSKCEATSLYDSCHSNVIQVVPTWRVLKPHLSLIDSVLGSCLVPVIYSSYDMYLACNIIVHMTCDSRTIQYTVQYIILYCCYELIAPYTIQPSATSCYSILELFHSCVSDVCATPRPGK